MKIAYCLNIFPKLSESFILNEIVDLVKRGHNVYIFSMNGPVEDIMHEEIIEYGLLEKTYYFNLKMLSYLKKIKLWFFLKSIFNDILNFGISWRKIKLNLKLAYFATIMDKTGIDLIHAHFGNVGNHSLRLKYLLKKPLITSFYGIDAAIADHTTYLELFNTNGVITVLSNDMKNDLIKLGCPDEKILIHHLGVNMNKFSYIERNVKTSEKIKFLSIGRFVEKKGITYTIKAFSKLFIENKNIELRIIGDGGMRTEIEDLIRELGLQSEVLLLGSYPLNKVIDEMHRSHIFLLPSIIAENGDKEGTPTVLMEAQATGMPVISTYHAGIPEVVINGKTGCLVEVRNVISLYKEMKYLVEHPDLWIEFGKNGRKHIEHNYNISRQVKILENVYMDMIESK